MTTGISAEAIRDVRQRIAPHIRTTPMLEIDASGLGLPAAPLVLKLELMQHSGSFKARGAFASLLTEPVPAEGVAAASGGNHGAAVAFAARALGIKARIFVPTISSIAKIQRIRDYGAELVVEGDRYADALALCDAYCATSGARSIHAYDQAATLLGQGTLGLEILEQAPQIDTLLVAVGGGGLIGGIAAACAGAVAKWATEAPARRAGCASGHPKAQLKRIVAVESDGAPTLHMAFASGRPVDAPQGGIAADSLAPRQVGTMMFPIAQQHVERVVLVTDDAIRGAQATLWDRLRVVAEPGGAAALAALISGAYVPAKGERVCVLICGGNTTAVDFGR